MFTSVPAARAAVCLIAVVVVSGCSSTRFGKCKDCQSNAVYPSQPCYDCMDSEYTPQAPLQQPAPVPAAEPLPMPGASDLAVPPPPEAVRARPINQLSATTRGWYSSASQSVRAVFTR